MSTRCFEPPRSVDLPATGGRIGNDPEDFRVDEIPLYAASGSGDHLYVRIEKRLWTTPDLVTAVSRASGSRERDIGYAGMKDKAGVTSQWLSLPRTSSRPPDEWNLPEGMKILEVTLHGNKLRTGHLTGNRFQIKIVEATAPQHSEAILEHLKSRGLLNYFGAQRFGRGLENLSRAIEWLRSGAESRGKRARFYQKLYPSVIQSDVFNRYVARRVLLGQDRVLEGEVMRLGGRGSVFVVERLEEEQARLERKEIAPTGPMPGGRVFAAHGAAAALEREVMDELGLDLASWELLGRQVPGTRRDIAVNVDGLTLSDVQGDSFVLTFDLPAGGYATELVRAFTASPFNDDGRTRTPDPKA